MVVTVCDKLLFSVVSVLRIVQHLHDEQARFRTRWQLVRMWLQMAALCKASLCSSAITFAPHRWPFVPFVSGDPRMIIAAAEDKHINFLVTNCQSRRRLFHNRDNCLIVVTFKLPGVGSVNVTLTFHVFNFCGYDLPIGYWELELITCLIAWAWMMLQNILLQGCSSTASAAHFAIGIE